MGCDSGTPTPGTAMSLPVHRRDLPPEPAGTLFCMASAPADLSASTRALWAGLVKEFKLVHGVKAPGESDVIRLGEVLRAVDRLEAVGARLGQDGLTVLGSRGQERPHPLLNTERELRAEVGRGLVALGLTPQRRAQALELRRLKALTSG